MSEGHPYVSGAVLGGRYQLAELVSESLGASNWRAVDQVLHRNVRVEMLPADDPRAENFLQAARDSTHVTDHHFLRVLDLLQDEQGSHVVVREWAKAVPLSRLLAQSPLPNHRAAQVVADVAESIAHAHERGLVHRRLTPHQVLLKESGAVRIVGLGVATALAPIDHQDSDEDLAAYRAADVTALGKLLYACLVSRWPGGHVDGLRAAPTEHGHLLRPRQVRAGVARDVDDVCDRILEPSRHSRSALTDAASIARELFGLGDTDVTEETGAIAVSPDLLRLDPVVEPTGPPPGLEPPRRRPKAFEPPPPTRRKRGMDHLRTWTHGSRALIAAALATTLILIGAMAFLVGRESGRTADPFAESDPPSATAPIRPLPIKRVVDFDPQSDDGIENREEVGAVIDDDPATGWRTSTYYGRTDLGGLKDGVGIVLDLGQAREVSQVRLRLAGSPTDVSVLTAAATEDRVPTDLTRLREQSSLNGVGEDVSVALPPDTRTRYVVVWLRALPQIAPGEYRGEIRSAVVRGR